MELPNYLDYGKMLEMNPWAYGQAQEQVGLANQFQQDKLQQQKFQTQGIGLDTMFKGDSYGDRLRSGKAAADQAEFTASDAGIKNRINRATEGLQLDAAEKKLILEAHESDLKKMETLGQQWAYSTDPALRARGEQILRMHKDFVKLRDTQSFAAGESAKQRAHQTALERMRQEEMTKREQKRAELKATSSKETEKMSTDQRIGWYQGKAEEAYQAGDYDSYNYFQSQIQYLNSLLAARRPDAQAGKIDPGAVTGLPTIPPRQSPQAPQAPGARPPAAAPQMSLDQVQKMYPGKTAEEIRAAWKRKFGVDLQ